MKNFALIGNPNSGKTTLFNNLTGSAAHVGNWPGVTVDKKEGKYKICIELWGKNIIQELGDKNKMPSEEEKKILDEWHLRHNLIPN